MYPRWYRTVVLAVLVSQLLASSGAIEHHHRVARDEAEGLGGILETAKDAVNPEKVKDTITVVAGMLGGGEGLTLPGLGRKRRDLYSAASGLVNVDSGEVKLRVADVPEAVEAKTSGVSTPRERTRRAAQMPSPSSMIPGGMDPEEMKQKALDAMQSTGPGDSGMFPQPPSIPSIPGGERKRRAAQMPSPASMMPDGMSSMPSVPDGMTPPSSIPGGMSPPTSIPGGMSPSMPDGITPPSSIPGGMSPPTSIPGGMTPSMPGGMTPPSSIPGGMSPPTSIPGGMTPPSSIPGGMTPSMPGGMSPPSPMPPPRPMPEEMTPPPRNGGRRRIGKGRSKGAERNRRQSGEDMSEDRDKTKRNKHSKRKEKVRGKGKHRGSTTTTTAASTDTMP